MTRYNFSVCQAGIGHVNYFLFNVTGYIIFMHSVLDCNDAVLAVLTVKMATREMPILRT